MQTEDILENPIDFMDEIMESADPDWSEKQSLAYINAFSFLAMGLLTHGEKPTDHLEELKNSARQMIEDASEEEITGLASTDEEATEGEE